MPLDDGELYGLGLCMPEGTGTLIGPLVMQAILS